jgi:hypothetical protein
MIGNPYKMSTGSKVAELDIEKDDIGRVRLNEYLEVHGG